MQEAFLTTTTTCRGRGGKEREREKEGKGKEEGGRQKERAPGGREMEQKMMLIEKEVVKMEELERREGGNKVKVWDIESLTGQGGGGGRGGSDLKSFPFQAVAFTKPPAQKHSLALALPGEPAQMDLACWVIAFYQPWQNPAPAGRCAPELIPQKHLSRG